MNGESQHVIVSTTDGVGTQRICLWVRIVCKTRASGGEKVGRVSVEVSGGEVGLSSQMFSYQVSIHTHVQ